VNSINNMLSDIFAASSMILALIVLAQMLLR